MTPKEKALELVEDMRDTPEIGYNEHAKQCALIAVDEILKAVNNPDETYLMKHSVEYWQEVKEEIEKL